MLTSTATRPRGAYESLKLSLSCGPKTPTMTLVDPDSIYAEPCACDKTPCCKPTVTAIDR